MTPSAPPPRSRLATFRHRDMVPEPSRDHLVWSVRQHTNGFPRSLGSGTAVDTWLLPVPGGPRKRPTSSRSTNPSWARVRMRSRSSDDWNEKSKPVIVLIVAKRPFRRAILMRLFSRNVSSSQSRISMASDQVVADAIEHRGHSDQQSCS